MKGVEKMLECKTYNLTELKEILHISKRAWTERKEELLEYFKLFFDYEISISKGGSYQFTIKEQYAEYEPLPRKTKVPEIKAFYEQEVDHILQYKPRNTGSNLAREIICKNNKQNHKAGTAANYIRPYLKQNYDVHDKEWCQINYETSSYDIITDKQLAFLKLQFEKYLNSTEVADILADEEAGYFTKEEVYGSLKARYDSAIKDFQAEFGFRPYKAGELRKKAWVKEE